MAAESLLQVIELFPGPALIVGPGGEVVGLDDRIEALDRPNPGRAPRPAAVPDRGRAGRARGRLPGKWCAGRPEGGGDPHAAAGRGGRGGVPCRRDRGLRPGWRDEPPLSVVHVIPTEPGAATAPTATAREGTRGGMAPQGRVPRPAGARPAQPHRRHQRRPASVAGAAASREDLAWAEDTIERQLKQLVQQIDDLQDLTAHQPRDDRAAEAATGRHRDRPRRGVGDASPGSTSAGDGSPSPRLRARSRSTPTRRGWSRSSSACSATPSSPTDPGGRIRISVAQEPDAVVFRVRIAARRSPPRCLPRPFDPSSAAAPRKADWASG